MKINGLELPEAFVRDVQARRFDRPRGSWPLHQNQNAWGEFLETELGDVFEDESGIRMETDNLPKYFTPHEEGTPDSTTLPLDQPGEIPSIWDFSNIVCFAMAGDGAPFCFDFRENQGGPSVIWWADAFWQRVAPSYDEFILLFDIP